jgi:hypothetical protein
MNAFENRESRAHIWIYNFATVLEPARDYKSIDATNNVELRAAGWTRIAV